MAGQARQALELPSTFRELRNARARLFVRSEWVDALREWGVEDIEKRREDPEVIVERPLGRARHAVLLGPQAPAGAPSHAGRGERVRLFVREYRHGGLFGGLLGRAFFGDSRPRGEIAVTEAARDAGVRVPEILACVGRAGLVCQRWTMVQRHLDTHVDLIDWLDETREDPSDFARRKRSVITACARAVRRLHDAGVQHTDLHLKNIMIARNGDPAPVIVDFDKSEVHSPLSESRRLGSLIRLDRSVEKLNRRQERFSRTDRWRFFREYARGESYSRSRIEAFLAQRARELARHRTGWKLVAWLRGSRARGATS